MSNLLNQGISEFQVLRPNDLVAQVVDYIETQIPCFSSSEEFLEILEKKKNENQHSLSICAYMTNKSGSKFYFARENAQKGSSTIDIGVYFGSKLIFTIEAKVLPTPKGSTSKPRLEHEYVFGPGSGIQRFKEGKHGVDNLDNSLLENGMIAYIKEQSFEYWHGKVNQWIVDATWNKSEMLQKDYFNTSAKLISTHEKDDNSQLILHHFWVLV